MNNIYVYEGEFLEGEKGYDLLRRVASEYVSEAGMKYDMTEVPINREAKGKPYFRDVPVHFSISHSASMWVCLFSTDPCGLDLQIVKDCNYELIARKFYTEEEALAVKKEGSERFFDIWVRKEAFCKCTGTGLFRGMPSVTDKNGSIVPYIKWNAQKYYLNQLEISPEMKCAYCSKSDIKVEMRITD